jgi:hypothetical protein
MPTVLPSFHRLARVPRFVDPPHLSLTSDVGIFRRPFRFSLHAATCPRLLHSGRSISCLAAMLAFRPLSNEWPFELEPAEYSNGVHPAHRLEDLPESIAPVSHNHSG